MRGRPPNYKTPKELLNYHIKLYYRRRTSDPKQNKTNAEEIITHYQKELIKRNWQSEEKNEALKYYLDKLTGLWTKEREQEEKKKKLEEWKKTVKPIKF